MSALQQPTPHWPPTGLYPVDAVGVSFCHDEIADLAANPVDSSALVFCYASLVPYDDNKHDPNAVRVVIDGRKVGHLARELAVAFRLRLKESLSEFATTTCEAVISNGLVTADRSYSYTISLDFDLNTNPSVHITPRHSVLDRRDPQPEIIKDQDGCYRATVRLASGAVGNIHPRLATRSWTTDHWTTVNYYLDNPQGIGLAHKLLAIPKDRHFEMFGNDEPNVVIESLEGRVARVCLIPAPASVQRDSVVACGRGIPAISTYGAYVHYSPDGVPFYVCTAKSGESTKPRDDYIWSYYVENYLADRYDTRCPTGNTTYDDAVAFKNAFMAEHADTVLNRANLFRPVLPENSSRYHSLKDLHWKHRERAKTKEKTDPETAVAHYLRALEQLREFSSLICESGLFGRLIQEINLKPHSADAMAIMDRVSLLLCRMGKPEEARERLNKCLEQFPLAARSEKNEAILRRIEKYMNRRK